MLRVQEFTRKFQCSDVSFGHTGRPLWLLSVAVFAGSAHAQSADSLVLSNDRIGPIASDSQGNIIAVQPALLPFGGPGSIGPAFITVQAVYRYDTNGRPRGAWIDFGQFTSSATNVAFLALDGLDNVYFGGNDYTGAAYILRPSDPPGATPWKPALTGSQVRLVAMAFDAQNEPIFLTAGPQWGQGGSAVVKLDRVTGQVIAEYSFKTAFDSPEAIAVDGSGAVYVAGFTSSMAFPLTPGALQTSWPDKCVPAASQRVPSTARRASSLSSILRLPPSSTPRFSAEDSSTASPWERMAAPTLRVLLWSKASPRQPAPSSPCCQPGIDFPSTGRKPPASSAGSARTGHR
jgi:hypothetical protein